MECLVDDTTNCNVPRFCPGCGRDEATSSVHHNAIQSHGLVPDVGSPQPYCCVFAGVHDFLEPDSRPQNSNAVGTTVEDIVVNCNNNVGQRFHTNSSGNARYLNTSRDKPNTSFTNSPNNSSASPEPHVAHCIADNNSRRSSDDDSCNFQCSSSSTPCPHLALSHTGNCGTSFDTSSNIQHTAHTTDYRLYNNYPNISPTAHRQRHTRRSLQEPVSSQHARCSCVESVFGHPCSKYFTCNSVGASLTNHATFDQGRRVSLDSYLIPDPRAREDLERRLQAYNDAASNATPPYTPDLPVSPKPKGNHTQRFFPNSEPLSVPSSLPPNINHPVSTPQTRYSDTCCYNNTVTRGHISDNYGTLEQPFHHSLTQSLERNNTNVSCLPGLLSTEQHASVSNTDGSHLSQCSDRSTSLNKTAGPSASNDNSKTDHHTPFKPSPTASTHSTPHVALDPRSTDRPASSAWSRRDFLEKLHCQPVEDDVDDDGFDLLSADVITHLDLRNYSIHEVLGKGISSTVRRVTEKTTGQEYAVKIIDISGEKGEHEQVEQIRRDTFREIRILRMCGGHSNIIELRDVFETPTFIFLVFEICRKGELFDYLTSVISLSEKRTRIFMRQLIQAVDFLHDHNVVHRDLKPENILLDDNLNIKVSDFGFATVLEKGEELSELCGTPGYLAPEVLAHSMYENVSGYGKEVDMWACGVIMYTLLCGAPPFWHRRQMMMLRAIMNADYTFNNPEWDDITDAPKNLIEQLLVVNPQQRLTAKQALAHPFFCGQVCEEQKTFQGRRKFRAGAFCVIFIHRLGRFAKHPPPIPVSTVLENPYSVKAMRKAIDASAFSMYKHWVKRVENQNRAALFEHTLREDWRHSLASLGPEINKELRESLQF